MAAERYEAIRKHAQHRLDLSYQRNEKPHGVVGHIAKSEVYGQHKEWKPEKPKPMSSVERREEEEKREKEALAESVKEKNFQYAALEIKKRFGKNALLKGISLEDGATAKERNSQIGGHRA